MRRFTVLASIIAAASILLCATAAVGGPSAKERVGSYPMGSGPLSSAAGQRRDQRAEMLTERIDLVITRFDNNKQRHVAIYNDMKSEVVELMKALSAQGYDVTRLAADLQTWDGMFEKFARDYATFISLLEATKAYAPYGSGGRFAQALEQAREQLRVCRRDTLDIRLYYQQTIRSDITGVASQKPGTSVPGSSTP